MDEALATPRGGPPPTDFAARIAVELALPVAGVRAVAMLLGEGATVPFIARYRKEPTGGLDEVAIRAIEEKRAYFIEIDERRKAILAEIDKQGKLSPELRKRIESVWVKAELEDLYLPFKPKRRTRAMIARERGLAPLAEKILEQPSNGSPEVDAARFVSAAKEVPDVKAALAGARDIVAEGIAERADVRAKARRRFDEEGMVECRAVPEKTKVPTKFEAYYDYAERTTRIPSHRYLAIRRGENEGILRAKVTVDDGRLGEEIAAMVGVRRASPYAAELHDAAVDATKRLLLPSIETDVRLDLKLASDREAVAVFAQNLTELLLSPPLGRRVVLGIDPGQRTGCKCVVISDTGTLLTHTLVNLVAGEAAVAAAKATLRGLLVKYHPFAIAVGNGTHGRETADVCRAILKEDGTQGVIVVLVSESGASVYSASDVAREEFPDLDLTVRGAVSIARRLQDPLAELVKLDPKAIGVGQYQHDVHQPLLKRKLDEVVESCVNAVGVELNTASAPLLARVAGVGPSLAKKIVKHRDEHGAFASRAGLLAVAGLGPSAFEQCAGFVRIRGAKNPLDASAVHPERYALVEQIANDAGVPLERLVGSGDIASKIPWHRYVSNDVGALTLADIQEEIAKPGRDPREAFEAPSFRDDVRKLDDLELGMVLEGVITNVTAFGAFVDIGVHQDGLVHVSQLRDTFVKDPHAVARVGEKITVRVLAVDLGRKRIALSARQGAPESQDRGGATRPTPGKRAGT